MPKNWDDMVNDLLGRSLKIQAPEDASDQFQLKIFVQQWIEKMREAEFYQELKTGYHLTREITTKEYGTKTYICFQSTPLLDKLKKQYNRVFQSNKLWAAHVSKWGGIVHSFRVPEPGGGSKTASNLWCLPLDFVGDKRAKEQQQAMQINLEDF